jgi:hypothetical protein
VIEGNPVGFSVTGSDAVGSNTVENKVVCPAIAARCSPAQAFTPLSWTTPNSSTGRARPWRPFSPISMIPAAMLRSQVASHGRADPAAGTPQPIDCLCEVD